MPLQNRMAVCLLVVASCGRAELRPARLAEGGTVAVDENRGVRVHADPLAWTGSVVVQRELVPIELVIENGGNEHVYFSRADVALAGSGHWLLPVAPERVELAPDHVALGLDPRTPEYVHSQPGGNYRPPEHEQPTAELRAAAVAEGVILPDQVRRGFVYFERLPKDLERAELHVVLRAAPGSSAVASVVIPFVVAR